MKRFRQSGLAETVIASYAMAGVGLISGVVAARTLTPEARGDLAIAILWPTILAMVADVGLGFAFAYYAGRRSDINAIWTVSVIASVLLGGSCAAIAITATQCLWPKWSGAAIVIGCLTIPLNLMSGYQAQILLGRDLMKEQLLIRLTVPVAYTYGIIAFALTRRGSVRNYMLAFLLAHVSGALIALMLSHRSLQPRLCRVPVGFLQVLFRYGAKTYICSIAGHTSLRLDQLIISTVLTKSEVGYYAISTSIASILNPLFTAAAMIVLPLAIALPANQDGRGKVMGRVWVIILVSVPILCVSVVFTPIILPMLFGPAYEPSVLPAQVLILASLFQGLNAIFGNGLRGFGRPGFAAGAEVVGMVVTMLLLWAILPVWRTTGAAATSLIAYGTVSLLLSICLLRMRDGRGPTSSPAMTPNTVLSSADTLHR